MKTYFLLAMILGLTFSAAAQAAVITLKNGSVRHGTIVSATAQTMQVHGEQGLESIQTDQISHIDYEQAQPIPRRRPASPIRRAPAAYQQRLALPEQYFSLGFGGGIPLTEIDFGSVGGGHSSRGSAGSLFTPQYLFQMDSHWWTGLELDYFGRAQNVTGSLLPSSDTRVYGDQLAILPVVKYSFVDQGFARPYIAAGVGGQRTTTVIEAQPNPGFVWNDTSTDEVRTLVDGAQWGLATTVRTGIDFSWYDPSVFSVEVGWTRFQGPDFTPTPAGQALGLTPVSGTTSNLSLLFRWGWRF